VCDPEERMLKINSKIAEASTNLRKIEQLLKAEIPNQFEEAHIQFN
jgi:hypothetical protein